MKKKKKITLQRFAKIKQIENFILFGFLQKYSCKITDIATSERKKLLLKYNEEYE